MVVDQDGWIPLGQKRNAKKAEKISGDLQIEARFLPSVPTIKESEDESKGDINQAAEQPIKEVQPIASTEALKNQTNDSPVVDQKDAAEHGKSQVLAKPTPVAPVATKELTTARTVKQLQVQVIAGRCLASKDSNGTFVSFYQSRATPRDSLRMKRVL